MARKYRHHDERRDTILDGAWQLFSTRGYEATTIAAIISHLQISKGAFYHYFASKEEVLDAITDRLAAEGLEDLQRIIDTPDEPAAEKLNRFLVSARRWRVRHMDSVFTVAGVLYRDENLIIRHKMVSRLQQALIPLLRQILDQGTNENVFHVSSTAEAALVFWQVSNAFAESQMATLLSDGPIDVRVAEMSDRALFVIEALERILGADAGLIDRPDDQFFTTFAEAAAKAAGTT